MTFLVSATERASIIKLVVTMFNAAPGATYLAELATSFEANGRSLVKLAGDLANTTAYNTLNPVFQTAGEFATAFLKPLGLQDNQMAKDWVASKLETGVNKGQIAYDASTALNAYTGTDAELLAAKAILSNKADVAEYYSVTKGVAETDLTVLKAALAGVTAEVATIKASTDAMDGTDSPSASATLARGVDSLAGTTGDDTFEARILDNGNTLQSGDKINGGAGNDRLNADIGASQNFAITAETTGVETVAIRAQAQQRDSGDNNIAAPGVGQIDAQRMVGVNQWESSNSRADVVIEDVRILDSQITKNITIAMIETDPGHVDFGVYFDQHSLRSSATTSASQVAIQLRDGISTNNAAPLGNLMVDGVKFTLTTPASGDKPASTVNIVLQSADIDAASNYTELAAALNKAIAASPEASAAKLVASIGSAFTGLNGVANNSDGFDILITSPSGQAFSKPIFTYAQSATGAFILLGNTSVGAATQSIDPVTSEIILDDVGRGSTGGDLVVGGLSVGQTSSSQGVERFEIQVRDNSKLETISSTNNTLEEVTIENGLTTSGDYAYGTTVTNEGDLTVNGVSGPNGANVTNIPNPAGTVPDPLGANNASLPGSAQQQANGFGFSDVRLIDANTFKGNLAFSAEVTNASILKYLNPQDIQALPKDDNVDFIYTGGSNDDTMFIRIDTGVASSRNTIVSGREDFTFTANGGAGDDTINLGLVNSLAGGNQAWYTNQSLNKNVFINGGAGDDTITTPGAGNVIINGGAGNDTVYTDNTGVQATPAPAGSAAAAAAAYSAAAAAELAAAITAATAADATNVGVLGAKVTNLVALGNNPATAAGQADADVTTAITAAFTANAITAAQQTALQTAYGTKVAGVVTAAQLKAGDALLAGYLTAARSEFAAATAADSTDGTHKALLNATQTAVVNATIALNGVSGTAADVANLAVLQSAITVGATDAAVQAATKAALDKGAITPANKAFIDAAAVAGGAGTVDAAELKGVTALLAPLQATANISKAQDEKDLATALKNDADAVDTVANSIDPVWGNSSWGDKDSVGTSETATAAKTAATAVTTAEKALADATTDGANLAALKAAIKEGTLDFQVGIATQAAVVNGAITAADKAVIDAAGIAGAANVDKAEKTAVDTLITAWQTANAHDVAVKTILVTDAKAIATLTATAALAAAEAKNSGPAPAGPALPPSTSTGTYVFNTANQLNVGSGYNLTTNDERNGADLKSDSNDSYNLFKSTLTVSFKGISATVKVPEDLASYKTTDLQINQAIKEAINTDAVLSKLLVADDGPGNTLVVTSLIDGVLSTNDLSVSIAVPKASDLTGDLSHIATAYGVTTEQVIATMTAAKAAFDKNADYVDQLAETGAANGNALVTGAASLSSSDNTVTGGAGNDVIVLGTTLGSSALASSNDTVVFTGSGNGTDSIVNFVSGNGFDSDVLNFKAYDVSGVYVDGALVAGAAPTAKLGEYIALVESKTNSGEYTMSVLDSGADNAFGGTGANLDVVVTTIGVVDFGAHQVFVAHNFTI